MKFAKYFGICLLGLLLLASLVTASSVATWATWVVDGNSQQSSTLSIERGETVQFNVVVDSFSNFDLTVNVLNSNHQVIDTLFNVDNLRSTYPEYYQREFTYTPTTAGNYYISINAVTGSSSSNDELTLRVNAPTQPPVNHAPTFEVQPAAHYISQGKLNYNSYVDTVFNWHFIGQDQDADDVHFTVTSVSGYSLINGLLTQGQTQTAVYDWTVPTVNEFAMQVTAVDEHGLTSEPKIIVVHAANRAPILTPLTEPASEDAESWTYQIFLWEDLDVTINAKELDHQSLAFSVGHVSSSQILRNADYDYETIGLSEQNIRLRWEPTSVGNFAVRFTANDGHGGVTSKVLKVEVTGGLIVVPFFGCTDEDALNYNENAVIDDGSCIYEFHKLGCTNPIALNYDETAEINDGSCIYGLPDVDLPDLPTISGCTSPKAVNYNPYAILDDGSCEFRPFPPLVDFGCTDPEAENYDSDAEIDDGSCTYPSAPRNSAPVIESIADKKVQETHTLSFTVSAEDSDGPQRLTYEFRPYRPYRVSGQLSLPPAGSWEASFDAQSGVYTFTPSYEFVQHPLRESSFGLEFRAFDGDKYSAWEQVKITVLDLNRNPEITEMDVPAAGRVGESVTFSGEAIDADNDALTYVWTIDSAEQSGTTATHTFDEKGVYTITLTVTDNFGGRDSESKILKVNSPLPVLIPGCTDPRYEEYNSKATIDDGSCKNLIDIEQNTAPVMDAIKELTVKEGETLAFSVNAEDAENDQLTYDIKAYRLVFGFLHVGLKGVTFNTLTGEFSFSPDYDYVKHPKLSELAYAEFRAFDGEEYSEWAETRINILDVNRDPVINSVDTPTSVLVGEETDFSAVATDADEDALTYTWTFGQVSENGASVEHTFTAVGEYTITLVVTDAYGGEDTWTGSVEVNTVVVEVPGCTNPIYVEYDSDATVDDGSCHTLKDYGCTNPDYVEYDPSANTDDGSCNTLKVSGCTDVEADNYNSNANVDDGSCEFIVRKERDFYIAYAHPLNEQTQAGATETFNVKVVNPTSQDIEDLRMTVVLYDLNLRQSTSVFDLDADDDTNKIVSLQLPEDAPAGDYLVKITVSNDYLHESVYRQIVIS